MKCPFCGDQESKVVDSRHSEDGLSIRRRRECMGCQRRFTTYEIVESLPIIVVKRNGSRQNFDRNKILNSMIRAFDKRRVDVTVLYHPSQDLGEDPIWPVYDVKNYGKPKELHPWFAEWLQEWTAK